MKAAYLKAKNQFEIRDVELRKPEKDEVIVRVKACGFCGHDKILANYAAMDWQPFGHEFSGIVEEIGSEVTNVKINDRVVIETSTFDSLSPETQNGRPDLSTKGPSYMDMKHNAMGFAERTIVPSMLCMPFDGLSDREACFLEPMGVAADLIWTAGIHLNDDVLVMGCGAIGLMALQMAKASGARHIFAADHKANRKKTELAKAFGADDVILTDEMDITAYKFPRGGLDKILVTTPPKTIDQAVKVANTGAVIAFLGISYGPDAIVSFDSNIVHLEKLQIRGSNAIPALYFPRCFDLLKAGIVKVKPLISHTFSLEKTPQGINEFLTDKQNAVKALMIAKD